jgi:hypothetical protein
MVDRLDITHIPSGSRFLVAADSCETLERLSLQISALLEAIPNLYAAASVLPGHATPGSASSWPEVICAA